MVQKVSGMRVTNGTEFNVTVSVVDAANDVIYKLGHIASRSVVSFEFKNVTGLQPGNILQVKASSDMEAFVVSPDKFEVDFNSSIYTYITVGGAVTTPTIILTDSGPDLEVLTPNHDFKCQQSQIGMCFQYIYM
ncbi:hypothetical protein GYMLUDRAFT_59405 [Collybiopsis luxurians FD-317 M1]|uniref:Uncharacterized protein n=1 Tax=Collybiopsis luxurians FD-317 M1 TaxID=944289 RepID=A0A0D0BY54_9AGAR|nr:hypothetical protein GYMLUDRAFT_59405 [Collybiopsis luxurians FD-317 M1]